MVKVIAYRKSSDIVAGEFPADPLDEYTLLGPDLIAKYLERHTAEFGGGVGVAWFNDDNEQTTAEMVADALAEMLSEVPYEDHETVIQVTGYNKPDADYGLGLYAAIGYMEAGTRFDAEIRTRGTMKALVLSQNWTCVSPTKSGYYWFIGSNYKAPIMVRVEVHEGGSVTICDNTLEQFLNNNTRPPGKHPVWCLHRLVDGKPYLTTWTNAIRVDGPVSPSTLSFRPAYLDAGAEIRHLYNIEG